LLCTKKQRKIEGEEDEEMGRYTTLVVMEGKG
jgi:hypothetical protein